MTIDTGNVLASSIQRAGGRARAEKLTPERRSEIARAAGKASATKRAKEREDARRISAQVNGHFQEVFRAAEKTNGERAFEAIGGMFSAGAQQLERVAEAVGLRGAVVKVKSAPKRSEPKAGTISALVLAYLYRRTLRGKGARTLEDIAEGTGLTNSQASNALSSLRSAGHVVSEPKPGSRREKLWRLA